mmetsp:Transcript_69359/g.212644  ORF Transcript_69359/g.212644 Transcript_69359/m.212644 type:complete len:300 (-) Transcript_69359:15-914(-)
MLRPVHAPGAPGPGQGQPQGRAQGRPGHRRQRRRRARAPAGRRQRAAARALAVQPARAGAEQPEGRRARPLRDREGLHRDRARLPARPGHGGAHDRHRGRGPRGGVEPGRGAGARPRGVPAGLDLLVQHRAGGFPAVGEAGGRVAVAHPDARVAADVAVGGHLDTAGGQDVVAPPDPVAFPDPVAHPARRAAGGVADGVDVGTAGRQCRWKGDEIENACRPVAWSCAAAGRRLVEGPLADDQPGCAGFAAARRLPRRHPGDLPGGLRRQGRADHQGRGWCGRWAVQGLRRRGRGVAGGF